MISEEPRITFNIPYEDIDEYALIIDDSEFPIKFSQLIKSINIKVKEN